MKVRLDLEFSEEQLTYFKRMFAVRGCLRDNPRKPWTDKEVKEVVKMMAKAIIDEEFTRGYGQVSLREGKML